MGLLDEVRKHISETYGTLSGGRVGQRSRGLLDMVEGNIKQGLPLLDKNPRDWQAEDILNVAMGGTIAGRAAKTLNPRTAQLADDMKAKGSSRDDIWNATGKETGQPAFYDKDGNFKWEIDDSRYKYTPEKLSNNPDGYKIGHVSDSTYHPALKEAYPEINKTQAVDYPFSGDSLGEFRRASEYFDSPPSVTLWDGLFSNKPSTNLHELNHNIQSIEGFPGGGNNKMFKHRLNSSWEGTPKAKRFSDITESMAYKNELIENNKKYNEIVGKDGWDKDNYDDLYAEFNVWAEANTPLMMEADAISASLGKRNLTPQDQYQRLTGEADARAVQKRMDMTMQQRKDKPFYKDYDVPEDEFIYQYDNGGLLDIKR